MDPGRFFRTDESANGLLWQVYVQRRPRETGAGLLSGNRAFSELRSLRPSGNRATGAFPFACDVAATGNQRGMSPSAPYKPHVLCGGCVVFRRYISNCRKDGTIFNKQTCNCRNIKKHSAIYQGVSPDGLASSGSCPTWGGLFFISVPGGHLSYPHFACCRLTDERPAVPAAVPAGWAVVVKLACHLAVRRGPDPFLVARATREVPQATLPYHPKAGVKMRFSLGNFSPAEVSL